MKMASNIRTNEDELKNEDILKNWPPTQKQFCPPPPSSLITILPDFLKTSHLDSHTTYGQISWECILEKSCVTVSWSI